MRRQLGATAAAHAAALPGAVARLSRAAAVAAEIPEGNSRRAFDQLVRLTREAARVNTQLEMVPEAKRDPALRERLQHAAQVMRARYGALARIAEDAGARRGDPAAVAANTYRATLAALRVGFDAARGMGRGERDDSGELPTAAAWARYEGRAAPAGAREAVAERLRGRASTSTRFRVWDIPTPERCETVFNAWVEADASLTALDALARFAGQRRPAPNVRNAVGRLRAVVDRCVVPRRMTGRLPGATWTMPGGGILEIDGAYGRRRTRRRR